MSKKIYSADVQPPKNLRVRFFTTHKNATGKEKLQDVSNQVAKIIIEDLEDESGACMLLRFDNQDKLVWKTRHASLKETKWHLEFEYGLQDDKLLPIV